MARVFGFQPEVGQHVDHFGSDFVISRIFHSDRLHVGCMRLGPDGLIGLHPAASPQILAIIEGRGWIRGADEHRTPIAAGEAVFWGKGEMHETGTETGLVALVIEAPDLKDGAAMGPIPEELRKPRPGE